MIRRVAKKAHKDITVVDLKGIQHWVKILNFVYSGSKLSKIDRQAVAEPTTGLVPGDIFQLPSSESYTVVNKVPDYYRGEMIRYNMDLIDNNNTATITRQTVVKSAQGGIGSKLDTVLHSNVPCKTMTVYTKDDKDLDVELGRFSVLLSTAFPAQIGDRITFGALFDEAKVKHIKRNQAGIQEILFDEDPRWL